MRFFDPGLDHKRVTNLSLRTNYYHFSHLQVGVLNGALQNQDTGYQDPPIRGTQTHAPKSKYCLLVAETKLTSSVPRGPNIRSLWTLSVSCCRGSCVISKPLCELNKKKQLNSPRCRKVWGNISVLLFYPLQNITTKEHAEWMGTVKLQMRIFNLWKCEHVTNFLL